MYRNGWVGSMSAQSKCQKKALPTQKHYSLELESKDIEEIMVQDTLAPTSLYSMRLTERGKHFRYIGI